MMTEEEKVAGKGTQMFRQLGFPNVGAVESD